MTGFSLSLITPITTTTLLIDTRGRHTKQKGRKKFMCVSKSFISNDFSTTKSTLKGWLAFFDQL